MADDYEEYPEERLDYSPWSGPKGSHEKSYEQNAPTTNDGRSKTRTKFYANQADHPSVDYTKLAKINDGMYSRDRDKREAMSDLKHDLDIFFEQLDLTWQQEQRTEKLVTSIENVDQYQSYDVLLLSVISLIANEDDWMIRQEDSFNELRDICNVTRKNIRKARQKLRENVL